MTAMAIHWNHVMHQDRLIGFNPHATQHQPGRSVTNEIDARQVAGLARDRNVSIVSDLRGMALMTTSALHRRLMVMRIADRIGMT